MFTLVTYLPLSFVMHIWIKRRCGGGLRFIIMWPPSSTGSEKSISRYPFEACLFVFLTELTTSRWQHIYANWGIFLTHLIFLNQSLQIRWDFPMSHSAVNLVAPFHTLFRPSYSCGALSVTSEVSIVLLHCSCLPALTTKTRGLPQGIVVCQDAQLFGISRSQTLTHPVTLCEDRLAPFMITIQSFTLLHGCTQRRTNCWCDSSQKHFDLLLL